MSIISYFCQSRGNLWASSSTSSFANQLNSWMCLIHSPTRCGWMKNRKIPSVITGRVRVGKKCWHEISEWSGFLASMSLVSKRLLIFRRLDENRCNNTRNVSVFMADKVLIRRLLIEIITWQLVMWQAPVVESKQNATLHFSILIHRVWWHTFVPELSRDQFAAFCLRVVGRLPLFYLRHNKLSYK